MKKILVLLSLISIMSLAAFGEVANGKWALQGSAKNAPKVLALRVDGTKLSGTMDGVPISNGKVEGDFMWFEVVRQGVTTQYKGRVTGDKIGLFESGPQVKRSLSFSRAQ
jgi:hypothetical protein